MPLILPVLGLTMPRLRLTLVEDLTDRLLDPLAEGRLDAALIASEPAGSGLRDDVLFDEPFWLIMPEHNLLARQDSVAASEITAGSMLLLQDGHCLRDQALDFCSRPSGEALAMADMRATSLDTLLQMAAAGYGLTLMPDLAIARDVPLPRSLVARRLSGAHTSRRVRLVSRPASARRVTLDRLAEVVKGCVPAG